MTEKFNEKITMLRKHLRKCLLMKKWLKKDEMGLV